MDMTFFVVVFYSWTGVKNRASSAVTVTEPHSVAEEGFCKKMRKDFWGKQGGV